MNPKSKNTKLLADIEELSTQLSQILQQHKEVNIHTSSQHESMQILVSLINDVLEIARRNQTLIESNQELDAFCYTVSHELQEPLRGIHAQATFLEDDYKDKLDNDGKIRLHKMRQLAEDSENIIQDLLKYSRVTGIELAITPCDINDLVKKKLILLDTLIKRQRVAITIVHRLPIIACDHVRMGEVFQNLILNAIKYNRSKHKKITIDYAKNPEFTIFSITDNGIGIAPGNEEKIFELFNRLEDSQDYSEGHGIGLSLVKKIIERHNGKVWFKSKPGKGTTFYFSVANDLL